jgi:hypothetical protein
MTDDSPEYEPTEAEARFWEWFSANATKIREMDDEDLVSFGEANDQASLVSLGLSTMFSPRAEDGSRIMIVTAQGDTDYFEAAYDLVAAAPEIDGWDFVPLMPRSPSPLFEFPFGDRTLTTEQIPFLPIEMDVDGGEDRDLGVLIYAPGFDPEGEDSDGLTDVLGSLVEVLLGEEDFAMLSVVEVVGELSDEEKKALLPLAALPGVFDQYYGLDDEHEHGCGCGDAGCEN